MGFQGQDLGVSLSRHKRAWGYLVPDLPKQLKDLPTAPEKGVLRQFFLLALDVQVPSRGEKAFGVLDDELAFPFGDVATDCWLTGSDDTAWAPFFAFLV